MPITAADLQKSFETDPELRALRARQNAEAQERQARATAEQQPVLTDLRQVGVDYDTLTAMLMSSTPYPTAIPILLKHLSLGYSDWTRSMIARCLATKEAIPFWDFLVKAYEDEEADKSESGGNLTKQGLAVAVQATVTPENTPKLFDLLKNKNLGDSRVLLLLPLRRRFKDPKVKAMLGILVQDPALQKEIKAWKKGL